MTDEDLKAAFEDGSLPPDVFDHAAHVQLAWVYVHELALPQAIERFIDGLRAFTRQHGDEAKYHETISWFFLLLIADRQGKTRAKTYVEFIEANPDLIASSKAVLSRYYRSETLAADGARAHFTLPDNFAA